MKNEDLETLLKLLIRNSVEEFQDGNIRIKFKPGYQQKDEMDFENFKENLNQIDKEFDDPEDISIPNFSPPDYSI